MKLHSCDLFSMCKNGGLAAKSTAELEVVRKTHAEMRESRGNCRIRRIMQEEVCMKERLLRCHFHIYGQVQGVGFRYRAEHAAGLLGVTGWVRNDPDGAVEMEIQGSLEQMEKLLHIIQQGTYVRIDRIDKKEIPLKEQEMGFRVRD